MLDEVFLTTSIVKRFNRGEPMGSASGFFFGDEGRETFFITNKHVIYGENYYEEDAQPEIDEIKLNLHSDRNDFSISSDIPISLFIDGKPIWKEHENKTIDVVVIPVNFNESKKYLFFRFGREYLDSSNIKVGFEKIFIIGYPLGWYDDKFNLPISRIGHLSSPFGIPFKGQPFMLADVETHNGMSGSPAIIEIKDPTLIKEGKSIIQMGKTRRILVGVFSGKPIWKVKNREGEVAEISHSLSAIWFGKIITEIIEK